MKEKFSNEWTKTLDAMRSNIEQKEKLIDKLIGENAAKDQTIAELLAVCVFTWELLINLSTEEFSKGGDRPARDKLGAAIKKHGGG